MTRDWTLGRLNEDATWWLDLGDTRVVFDPWLVGEEVDGWAWFHVATHRGPVVPPAAVPLVDAIVVSQGYADHLHPETLARMDPSLPVWAVPEAVASVRSARGGEVGEIPLWPHKAVVGEARISRLTRAWHRPPRYHAIVVSDAHGRAAVHAPHGLAADDARTVAADHDVLLLAITRQHFRLPFWLGGSVNPGPEAADAAAVASGARHRLAIHDEVKDERGLVARLARVRRPSCGKGWVEAPVGASVPIR